MADRPPDRRPRLDFAIPDELLLAATHADAHDAGLTLLVFTAAVPLMGLVDNTSPFAFLGIVAPVGRQWR